LQEVVNSKPDFRAVIVNETNLIHYFNFEEVNFKLRRRYLIFKEWETNNIIIF